MGEETETAVVGQQLPVHHRHPDGSAMHHLGPEIAVG
jgi:hypothetical protein